MFPTASLLSTLLLSLAVTANPVVTVRDSPITLPLARRLSLSGIRNLVSHDVARAKALRQGVRSLTKRDGTDQPLTSPGNHYVASVGVGSPATTYDLLIDTGSSNTWVGARTPYTPTSSSYDTGDSFNVTYGSGNFTGKEYLDTVTLGGLVLTNQSIGAASKAEGFQGVDGILGIGPVNLTIGTLLGSNKSIPTVTDTAYSQGLIASESIGISFNPYSSNNEQNGALTWGGTNSSHFTGDIAYVPLTTTAPANDYWGINQTITYGDTTILDNSAGITDTGTTLLLLATDAFNLYQKATGGVLDTETGLLKISSSQYNALQDLNFLIGGITYKFTPNAQIWPRVLNTAIGGNSSEIYLVVSDIGNSSGTGLDWTNGMVWLERFYSVYDTANQQIGFATTPYTDATTN